MVLDTASTAQQRSSNAPSTTAVKGRHSGRFLKTHGPLLLRVTRSELKARYAGSFLGAGWVVLAPLFIIAIYALVYLYIFKAATSATGLPPFEYLLYIVAGLVPYLVTAEVLGVGVGAVVANKSVLQNVVFPIDLVPAKTVLSSQPTMAAGACVLAIGATATGRLHWTFLLFPFVWVLQILALLGVVWVLSLLNIVLRDLGNIITVVLMMLLIASPIVYTTSMVPHKMKLILALNPLAYFIVVYQEICVLGTLPTPLQWVLLITFSLGSFAVGGWFFARAKAVLIDYV